jgi:hypothetical protein
VWFRGFVKVLDLVKARDQCFHAYLLDLRPHLISSFTKLFRMLIYIIQNIGDTSFMTNITLFFMLILNEHLRLFINSIIGKMHAKIVKITPSWALILFSRKSSETFLIYKAS